MLTMKTLFLTVVAAALLVVPAFAVKPTADEIDTARMWAKSHFEAGGKAATPFSFVYDGKASADLLENCKVVRAVKRLDRFRTQRSTTWTDPKTGLVVRCVAVAYKNFPTVEWTLYFKNTGKADSPILEDIQAVDLRLNRGTGDEFLLHHAVGSPCQPNDYQPLETVLGPKVEKRISAAGGRPTNSDLAYFNLEWQGQGMIIAVGWPGQWSALFARNESNGLAVVAGQELTHFRLHPGEEARSPLIALLFWKGDYVRSQNIWRRWMIAHNLPKPGGKLPPVEMAACSSHQFGEMINANTQNQELFIDRYLGEKLPLDFWHMDAGWYVNTSGWTNTGTWEVDQKRFPGGLRSISDYAHAKGVKVIVWFEPERVTPGTWLYTRHPEWLLTKPDDPHGWKLLNLGNSEARAWVRDHVDRLLTEQGIDLYRQDFNIDPLVFWRANDAEDRQGITEIQYVTGYMTYWDELRRCHPNMLIDSCASGGRRNDLETLRRAVPLLRSDYINAPAGNQCHTYGIAFWYPFYGTGTTAIDPYLFRSQMCPHFTACYDMRRSDLDFKLARKLVREWKYEVAPNYYGDYYPLTPYSLEENVWMAWQFDRPEEGQGVVQAFRRSDCAMESVTYRLRELQPQSRYELTDLDSNSKLLMTGQELMVQGLPIAIKEKPGAAVVIYRRIK